MNLRTLDTKETHLLYMDSTLFALMEKTMVGATFGKVKSVAEAMYTNFKGRMYILEEEGETVGIMGLSRPVNGEATIQHFSITASEQAFALAKAALKEVGESRRDLKLLTIRAADRESAEFYKTLGFRVKPYPDNPYGLDGFLCTYKF